MMKIIESNLNPNYSKQLNREHIYKIDININISSYKRSSLISENMLINIHENVFLYQYISFSSFFINNYTNFDQDCFDISLFYISLFGKRFFKEGK